MQAAPAVLHHFTITGANLRRDTVVARPVGQGSPRGTVVYLPGDVQTLEAEMPSADYAEFSLERTADVMASKFPEQAVLILRPTRFTPHEISEFDELLRPGICVLHMQALIVAADANLKQASLGSLPPPYTVVAFSKGCLVLNSLVSEIATLLATPSPPTMLDWDDPTFAARLPSHEGGCRIARSNASSSSFLQHAVAVRSFIDQLAALHWVDGHRFPTSDPVSEGFVRYLDARTQNSLPPLRLLVHVTPRQRDDPRRPYIREAMQLWLAVLKDRVSLHAYHEGRSDSRSLRVHFLSLHAMTSGT